MAKPNKPRTINVYSSYSFKNKDPIIHEVKTAFTDIGNLKDVIKECHERSGVAIGTLNNWFFGKTRRPQNPTIEAALRGVGLYRPIRPMTPEMKAELGFTGDDLRASLKARTIQLEPKKNGK